MKREYVTSSRISSVGWEHEVLEVEFKNGDIYQYQGVSENEYKHFMNASSLGSALSDLDKLHSYHKL